MKILVDMNLSPAWVPFFAAHDHEAVHWSTIGPASAPDSELLEYASANGLVIFTHDLDFGMLLAVRKTRGPSVVQIRSQDVLPSTIGETILLAIEATRSHLLTGALVTIDPERRRIRLLPI